MRVPQGSGLGKIPGATVWTAAVCGSFCSAPEIGLPHCISTVPGNLAFWLSLSLMLVVSLLIFRELESAGNMSTILQMLGIHG